MNGQRTLYVGRDKSGYYQQADSRTVNQGSSAYEHMLFTATFRAAFDGVDGVSVTLTLV
jgi:hypothetical protein